MCCFIAVSMCLFWFQIKSIYYTQRLDINVGSLGNVKLCGIEEI